MDVVVLLAVILGCGAVAGARAAVAFALVAKAAWLVPGWTGLDNVFEGGGLSDAALFGLLGVAALGEAIADALEPRAQRVLWWIRVAVAGALGALVGVAELGWAEPAVEAGAGLVAAAAAAILGGLVASRLTHQAAAGGGHWATLSGFVTIGALIAGALAAMVPFAGYVVAALVLVAAVRLRRRQQGKYKGLRILS